MSKDLQELQGKFDRTYDYLRTGNKPVPMTPVRVLNTSSPGTIWQTLDLSAQIPAGATAVNLNLILSNPGVDTYFSVSPTGGSDFYMLIVYAASETTWIVSNAGKIKVASDRTIQYRCNDGTVGSVAIWLGGYEIPILQG